MKSLFSFHKPQSETGDCDMHGYWKKPHLTRGDLVLGPIQFNWYARGFRIHFTWPFQRTVTLWQR